MDDGQNVFGVSFLGEGGNCLGLFLLVGGECSFVGSKLSFDGQLCFYVFSQLGKEFVQCLVVVVHSLVAVILVGLNGAHASFNYLANLVGASFCSEGLCFSENLVAMLCIGRLLR